ncbi:hypothetical protein Barb6_03885 [Bacteroidales bacterium Barb6]|nr:hypothetical protein Barb6_03885 [Bacteroidales bacterium Barb6]
MACLNLKEMEDKGENYRVKGDAAKGILKG